MREINMDLPRGQALDAFQRAACLIELGTDQRSGVHISAIGARWADSDAEPAEGQPAVHRRPVASWSA